MSFISHVNDAIERREAEQDAAEAPASSLPQTVWVPSPELRSDIDQIEAWRIAAGVSVEVLASYTLNPKTHKKRTAGTWRYKIVPGIYGGKDGTSIVHDFMAAAERCEQALVERSRGGPFVRTQVYEEFIEVIKTAEAREGLSAERLVMAVGRTRQGKTRSCVQAVEELGNGVMIHARRSWKYSYQAILRKVCRAVGVATVKPARSKRGKPTDMNAEELEDALEAELLATRRTLYFEELSKGNISPGLLELWVTLLNATKATVVLAMNPDALDYLRSVAKQKRPGDDGTPADIAAQILARGRMVVFAGVEQPAALAILERSMPGAPGLQEAAALLTEAGATGLGAYSLVTEVAKSLALTAPQGTTLTRTLVEREIARYNLRFVSGRQCADRVQSLGRAALCA